MAETASKILNKPTPVPTNKVIAGGVAGALVTIIVFVLNNYIFKDNKITPEISSAITVVITAIASYYTNPSSDQTTI